MHSRKSGRMALEMAVVRVVVLVWMHWRGCTSESLVGLIVLAVLLHQVRQGWVQVSVPGERVSLGGWGLETDRGRLSINLGD